MGDGSSLPQNQTLCDDEFQRLMDNPMSSYLGLLQSGVATGHHQQSSSCPAPPTLVDSGMEILNSTSSLPSAPKKRAKKTAAPKAKKSKRIVEIIDDEGEADDGTGSSRWNDLEVQQLISFRQQMDEEFERNAKKQGLQLQTSYGASCILLFLDCVSPFLYGAEQFFNFVSFCLFLLPICYSSHVFFSSSFYYI